ncbi:hypothetical protein ACFLYF_06590 [Chloroflexota bacterium]
MNLRVGDEVTAIIKATNVIVAKGVPTMLSATVTKRTDGIGLKVVSLATLRKYGAPLCPAVTGWVSIS